MLVGILALGVHSTSAQVIPPDIAVITEDSTVSAWGSNSNGQVQVPGGLTGGQAVAAGFSHTVALKLDGTVVVWGDNSRGQRNVPAGLSGVTAIAAGGYHTLALKSDGTVVAWGDSPNGFGESVVPANLTGVVAISAGSFHSLALKSNGAFVGWGRNDFGQAALPYAISPLAVSAGDAHTVAVDENGMVFAWGYNNYGQTNVPFELTSGVLAVAASGSYHSMALKANRTVVAWGNNGDGQSDVPAGLSGVAAIATGYFHSLALKSDGTVVSWGRNDYGQRNVPAGLSGVADIAAGHSHTVALSVPPISFRPQIVATTSPVKTVTIKNTGRSVLNLNSLTLTGGNITNFTLNTSGILSSLPAGGKTTVTIAFTPNAPGTYQTTLRVVSNDPDEGVFELAVSGTAAAPDITVTTGATNISGWGSNSNGQTTVPAGLSGVQAVSAGFSHTVALKFDGTVIVWGDNSRGQANVPAGLSGVTAISAGGYHTLALKSDGTVVAWGTSPHGFGESSVPANLTGVVAISAGSFHSLALKSNGTFVGWGRNDFGQSSLPGGVSGVVAIAAGDAHTLALKSDGTVAAWGYNDYRQANVPAGLNGVAAIAASGSYHSLALKTDGTVVAWGNNGDGQCNVPNGLSGVVAITTGYFHSVALKSDGTVVSWGRNDYGQRNVPAGLSGVVGIAAGHFHTIALFIPAPLPPITFALQTVATNSSAKTVTIKNDGFDVLTITSVSTTGGNAWDFSANTAGMLFSVPPGAQTTFSVTFTPTGIGTRQTTLRIQSNDPDENPVDIALTGLATGVAPNIAVFMGGSSFSAWGSNSNGQATVPPGLTGVQAISAGFYHTVALKTDGTVVAWGDNSRGQRNVPAGLSGVTAISAGGYHTLALKSDGTVVAWGDSQQGFGESTVIPGLTGVVGVSAGSYHSMALLSNGSIVGWGRDDFGQKSVPGGLSGVVAISAGDAHTMALKNDGTVTAWGWNYFGQTNVPAGLIGAVGIAASGSYHSMALRGDGTVAAWGNNSDGQCNVPAGLSGVVSIATGFSHSVALKSDGTVVTWGKNDAGQSNVPPSFSDGAAIAAGYSHTVALSFPVPAPIEFGNQMVATTSLAKTITIRNSGSAVLNIAGVSLTGGQVGDFTIDTSTMLTSLAAGVQTTIRVRFAPTAGGPRQATLRVISNDPDKGSFDTTLNGTGTTPEIAIEQPEGANLTSGISVISFGTQGALTTSPAKTITIKNTVTGVLNISNVTLTGGQSSSFAVNTAGMLTSVPAGGQTTFSVTFTPNASGLLQTTLRVQSNDADESAFNIGLSGSCLDPDIVIEQPAGSNMATGGVINFGYQTVGTTSPVKTFTIKNTGIAALNIASVSLTGGQPASFTLNTAGMLTSLPPGGQTTISVTFTASSTGVRQTTLRVQSNDFDETPFDIALNATGAVPNIGWGESVSGVHSSIITWGDNSYGQLNVPAGLTGVTSIAAGSAHSLALKSDSTVVAWGYNSAGRLNVPAGLTGVTAISAGASHSLALKSDGTVVGWGANNFGEATPPANLSGVTAISAGFSHSVALKNDGTVVAWGENFLNSLNVPAGLTGVRAVSAGFHHTQALKSDGTVVAWGLATDGYNYLSVPYGLTGVTAIFAGASHALALKSDGTVVTWGESFLEQTNVPEGLSGVLAISAGANHSLALKNDGTVVAWGLNDRGQTNVPSGLIGISAIAGGGGDSNGYSLAVQYAADFTPQSVATTSAAKIITIKNTGLGVLDITSTALTGGQTGDFTLNTAGMLTSVPPGGQTTVSVTFTPGAVGLRQTKLQVLSNDPDTAILSAAIIGTGNTLTPLENWRQLHFGVTTNTGNAANDADPDKDGLKNLVEYAFGLNPVTSSVLPATQNNGSNMVYNVPGVPGIIYGAETSTDLTTWLPLTDSGTGNSHVFTVPVTGAKSFMRLWVTAP